MLRTPFQLPPQGLLCRLLLHVLILCVHFEVMLCISAASHSPVERHGKLSTGTQAGFQRNPGKLQELTVSRLRNLYTVQVCTVWSTFISLLMQHAASIGNILYLDSSQRQSCTQHPLCIQLADSHLCSPHSQYSG